MIRRSFSHRGWFLRSACRFDGLRNSLPGFRNELPCAAMALSKSIRIERSIFELNAAAVSVFWNLKMNFLGTGHSLETICAIVLTRKEGGIVYEVCLFRGGFGDSPFRFGLGSADEFVL